MAFYDTDGWQNLAFNSASTPPAPPPPLLASAANSPRCPTQSVTYPYDGDGRATRQVTDNTPTTDEYETDTSYGGNWVTVTPPSGGTPQTTYTNGFGQTTYAYQYHASTPPGTPRPPGPRHHLHTAVTRPPTPTTRPGPGLDTITNDARQEMGLRVQHRRRPGTSDGDARHQAPPHRPTTPTATCCQPPTPTGQDHLLLLRLRRPSRPPSARPPPPVSPRPTRPRPGPTTPSRPGC